MCTYASPHAHWAVAGIKGSGRHVVLAVVACGRRAAPRCGKHVQNPATGLQHLLAAPVAGPIGLGLQGGCRRCPSSHWDGPEGQVLYQNLIYISFFAHQQHLRRACKTTVSGSVATSRAAPRAPSLPAATARVVVVCTTRRDQVEPLVMDTRGYFGPFWPTQQQTALPGPKD